MSRLQRLTFVAAFLTLLTVLLGGLLRATGTDFGCDGAWPLCGPGGTEPGFPLVVGALHGLAAALTGVLLLFVAVMLQRLPTGSGRSRRIAWLAAGVQLGGFALSSGIGAAWPSAVSQITGPVLAMILAGVVVLLCWSLADDRGAPVWLIVSGSGSDAAPDSALVWMTRMGVAALLVVVASGAITGAVSATLPCSSWPLCAGDGLLPDQPSAAVWLHMGHRLLTVVATIIMVAIVYRVWSRPAPRLARRLALVLAGVLIVQILLGGNLVIAGGPAWLDLLHLAAGLSLWLLAIALAAVAPRLAGLPGQARKAIRPASDHAGHVDPVARMEISGTANVVALPALAPPLPLTLPDPRVARALVADYVALMKPGILTLLLVTTFAAMLIAAAGLPPFALICITIAGGVLVAGGANVLNCFIDRDIDAQMARTRHRASASNRVPPSSVLIVGIGLTGAAVLLLGIGANWFAALLALAGNLYYVLVYTLWLKRRTPQNVVIGGAAGAVPPLVGWAAVTGDLSPIAWVLFAIIFMWTPPHSWALALLKQGEYGRAAVPMLPVVAGEAATRRQIVIYTLLLVLVCLALAPLGLGPVYLAAAVVINVVFLGLALQLYWQPSKRHARRLFFGSLWYLALIFVAAVADRLILG